MSYIYTMNEQQNDTMTTNFQELAKTVDQKNTSFVYETSTQKHDVEVQVEFCTCTISVRYFKKNTWVEDFEKREVFTSLYGSMFAPTSLEQKFDELIKRGF